MRGTMKRASYLDAATRRFGRLLQFLPTTILVLAMPLLAGCAPICEVVNSWSPCYSDIHGDDSSAVHSQIDEPPAAEFADAVERARPFVRALIVEENLPGLSLAVGIAGEIVWAEGFGWADIDERRPVTPKTLFRIGSVAKPMTATAAGLLHERGLLDLDTPVRDYVPSFPEKEWSVTTRQLMGHIAGVRDPPFDEELLYMRDHCESPLDGLELFADDPLLFAPGTRHRYSTYGWTLVGAVVEAAAGEPFLGFMQREVFDPSAMRDTALDDVLRPAARASTGHLPLVIRGTASRTPAMPTTLASRERAGSYRRRPTLSASVSRRSADAYCDPRRSTCCERRSSWSPASRRGMALAGSSGPPPSVRRRRQQQYSGTAEPRLGVTPRS